MFIIVPNTQVQNKELKIQNVTGKTLLFLKGQSIGHTINHELLKLHKFDCIKY
jgi:hypothetical protein